MLRIKCTTHASKVAAIGDFLESSDDTMFVIGRGAPREVLCATARMFGFDVDAPKSQCLEKFVVDARSAGGISKRMIVIAGVGAGAVNVERGRACFFV